MRAQLLTSATTIDGEVTDVLVDSSGTIAAIGAGLASPDGHAEISNPEISNPEISNPERVDLAGRMLLPAAVEPHAHLDKAFLAEVVPNPTGDLIGAIDAMREHRHLLTVDETVERAERAARHLASQGFVAVRTHADLTIEHGLTSIEALVEVRRRVASFLDIEIVALCGWPVSGPRGADQRALLIAGLDAGADLVGGCPHLEEIDGEGTIAEATDVLLQIASDHRRPVDLHTDETLDPSADGLDVLADRVLAGFDLPVTASHCVSLGQRTADAQDATARCVAEAGIAVIVLPHTNLYLQGRGRTPMPRGLTAIDALRRAGVVVAAGADNLQDPFNPLGRGCPFETAGLMMLTSHLLPADAWATVSTHAATALRRAPLNDSPTGLTVGQPADLLSVPARTVREAIALGPSDRWSWKAGVRRDVET